MYSSNIESLKRKGAPIDFVPVQPVAARPQGIGVARAAPHPNAALLFADFVLSPEGQKLFESLGRVPASHRGEALNVFPSRWSIHDGARRSARWEKLWNELFLRIDARHGRMYQPFAHSLAAWPARVFLLGEVRARSRSSRRDRRTHSLQRRAPPSLSLVRPALLGGPAWW
jgi:ABC-type glycerol-3-phosphate transport system substrate-binding protein